MYRRNYKKKKGISLIVLVITIIVMIILVAAVVVTLNNTGVIGRAHEATDKTNEALVKAVENCKKNNSALHMRGLVSDGGVHSNNTHIYGALELAKREGLEKVYVH